MKEETLNITDNFIKTSDNKTVMHNWERPIMKKMAEWVCKDGGDIIEFGFGMGIRKREAIAKWLNFPYKETQKDLSYRKTVLKRRIEDCQREIEAIEKEEQESKTKQY